LAYIAQATDNNFEACYTPVLAFVESDNIHFWWPLIVVNGKVQTPDCVYERILPSEKSLAQDDCAEMKRFHIDIIIEREKRKGEDLFGSPARR
jgi:hypothetical protein